MLMGRFVIIHVPLTNDDTLFPTDSASPYPVQVYRSYSHFINNNQKQEARYGRYRAVLHND